VILGTDIHILKGRRDLWVLCPHGNIFDILVVENESRCSKRQPLAGQVVGKDCPITFPRIKRPGVQGITAWQVIKNDG
jgi:hypothetical protein